MDFFEKVGKKASETYKTAAEKTNKIATDTKLKVKICENKDKIDDIYTEIGKKVYQKFVLDGNLDIENDIKEEVKRIKELTDEIEGYESQRLEMSDLRKCVQCKKAIEKDVKFCPYCGTEQPEAEETKAESEEECKSCECKKNESEEENDKPCDCTETNTEKEQNS